MNTSRHYRSRRRPITEALGTTMYVIDSATMEPHYMAMIVNQFDYPYTVVSSADELLYTAGVQPLPMDLVVVDLSLDGASGMALLEGLHGRAPASSILLLKADLQADTDLGFTVGMYAYTPRPMQLGEFSFGIAPENDDGQE